MGVEVNKIIYSMVGVSKFYNNKPVLKDIYLSYFYGAKIGVIGLNGSGKSSLLKILAGVDKNINGETVVSPGFTIGYLEQEPQLDDTKTVKEIVQEGVQSVVDLLKEYDEINDKFAQPMDDDEMTKLLEQQGEVQEKLEAMGGWDLDARLEMAMDALRCPPAEPCVKFFPEEKEEELHSADYFFKNQTYFYSMNQQTILMQKQLPGLNSICKNMKEL